MGIISEIFNFDNIGCKIKSFAKWSCWITILLIWVATPIAFIVLIANDRTAELCWIPLVGAVVGSVVIWLGSWTMYAFGEFVEKTANNEEYTRRILEKLTENDCDNDCTIGKNVNNEDVIKHNDCNDYTIDEDVDDEDVIKDDEQQEYIPLITEAERKQKIARITDLRKKGLISEELYQKAINNPRVLDKF